MGHIKLYYLAHAWWSYGAPLVQFWQRRSVPYLGHIQLYLAHAWWTYGTALVQFWQRRCGPYLGRQTQTNLGHSSAVYLAHIFAKGNLLTGKTTNINFTDY